MAPPRGRTSDLGEALRAARAALHFDQLDLARRIPVSSRLVSRWENGQRPTPDQAQRIFEVLSPAPGPVLLQLMDSLGIEIPEVEPPPAPSPPVAAAPQPLPVASAPPAPVATLRASFDAIIFAAAEERDVLPRHLRAFAVELLQGADRLGVSAKEAALLVAVPERGTKVAP